MRSCLHAAQVHHPSQSWKIDCHEGKPAQRPFAKSVSDSSYSSITLNAVAHHPDSSTDLLKKSSSMAPNLQEEPEGCLEYSPKSFTDMLTAPPADGIRGKLKTLVLNVDSMALHAVKSITGFQGTGVMNRKLLLMQAVWVSEYTLNEKSFLCSFLNPGTIIRKL